MNYAYLDIETDSKQSRIWMCCVDDSTFYTPEGLQEYLDGKYIVAHNGIAFDFYWLEKLWGIKIPEDKQVDTLVLSRLANADRQGGHSLEAWGVELGCHKLQQPIDFDKPDMQYLHTYCSQDVALLKKVHIALLEELKNFSEKSIQLEYASARVLAEQERYGWQIDVMKVLELKARFDDELAAIEKEMQEAFPPIITERYSVKTGKRLKDDVEVFNPGSRQQIVKRLQGLGWKPKKKTDKGNFVMDEAILDDIIAQCSNAA